jgi:hypothetical protein
VNRVTYMSNYSPELAPAGKTSFLFEATYPGGAPAPGASSSARPWAGVEGAGLLRHEEVLFVDRSVCPFAYIVYDHHLFARRTARSSGARPTGSCRSAASAATTTSTRTSA